MRKVAIVMGSKSDLPVAEKAVGVLRDYGVQQKSDTLLFLHFNVSDFLRFFL